MMKLTFKNSWLIALFLCNFYANAAVKEPLYYVCEFKIDEQKTVFITTQNGCPYESDKVHAIFNEEDEERIFPTPPLNQPINPRRPMYISPTQPSEEIEQIRQIFEERYPHLRLGSFNQVK